jgi:hypothetical protein
MTAGVYVAIVRLVSREVGLLLHNNIRNSPCGQGSTRSGPVRAMIQIGRRLSSRLADNP